MTRAKWGKWNCPGFRMAAGGLEHSPCLLILLNLCGTCWANLNVHFFCRTCIRKKSVLFRNDPRRYCQFGCNANTLCGSVVVPQRHLQVGLHITDIDKNMSFKWKLHSRIHLPNSVEKHIVKSEFKLGIWPVGANIYSKPCWCRRSMGASCTLPTNCFEHCLILFYDCYYG